MSTTPLYAPRNTGSSVEGWAYSFLLHGILIGLSFAFVTSLRLPPDPNLFKWEVALVEPPETAPKVEASAVRSQPSPPTPVHARSEKVSAILSRQSQIASVESQSIVKPVERMEAVQTIEKVSRVEAMQTVPTSQQVTRQEVKTVPPVAREAIREAVEPVLHSTEAVSLPTQSTGTSGAIESHALTRESQTARESRAVTSAPSTQEKKVVAQVTPVPETNLEQVRVETRTFSSRPLVEAKALPAPTKPSEAPKLGDVTPAGPTGMPKNKPAFVNLEASTERSSSFGWLTEAIKRSENQRRPVADHEGTTLFRITMRQDGRTVHLLDLSVLESSGYPQVDRAAADLVRRSFPIELTETLAKSQVRVDQPITIHTK